MATAVRSSVLVTRPAGEAGRWVDALRAAGIEAEALPLIEIAAQLPDAMAPLPPADAHDALMFVSAAAVAHFFRLRPMQAAGLGTARCWCTGPGTAAALQAAGVPAERIDTPPEAQARFDSEALWELVETQVRPGLRVLLVRGADAQGRPAGRDWLARRLVAADAAVQTVAVYRRLAPQFDEAARRRAQAAAHDGRWWLFSSSEAVGNLRAALPGQDWVGARALATHERIVEAARQAGFGRVEAVSPRLPEMVASIESLR